MAKLRTGELPWPRLGRFIIVGRRSNGRKRLKPPSVLKVLTSSHYARKAAEHRLGCTRCAIVHCAGSLRGAATSNGAIPWRPGHRPTSSEQISRLWITEDKRSGQTMRRYLAEAKCLPSSQRQPHAPMSRPVPTLERRAFSSKELDGCRIAPSFNVKCNARAS